MKIIDAHLHLVEMIAGYAGRGELRPTGNGKAIWSNGDIMNLIPQGYGDKDFTAEAAIRMLDENKVEKAVLMQGSMYGFQNQYTFEAVQKYPNRFAGACTVDPFMTNGEEILDRMLNQLNFKIVKFEMSTGGGLMGYHEVFSLNSDKMLKLYEKISNRKATLVLDIGDLNMKSYQPESVKKIATTFPSMKIVVCHLTAPTRGNEEILKRDLALLNLPNIWFDIAALPIIVSPEVYPYTTALNSLKIAKEIIGTKKIIWGTDAPMTVTRESYQGLINYILESNIFTNSELEDLFYNNASTVYFSRQ